MGIHDLMLEGKILRNVDAVSNIGVFAGARLVICGTCQWCLGAVEAKIPNGHSFVLLGYFCRKARSNDMVIVASQAVGLKRHVGIVYGFGIGGNYATDNALYFFANFSTWDCVKLAIRVVKSMRRGSTHYVCCRLPFSESRATQRG